MNKTKEWIKNNCRLANTSIPPEYRKHANSEFFKALYNLRQSIASAAQEVYDQWQQDNEGNDEVYGSGGICQDIAEAVAQVINNNTPFNTTTVSASCGEQHVWCVSYTETEAYSIDIPYHVYETGSGYNWKKKKNVKFDPAHIFFEEAPVPTNEYGYDD